MRKTRSLEGILLGCGLALLIACTREGPLSGDPKIAARQISQLLPPGASEERARKALTDRGFSLSRLNSDGAGNQLLVATYSQGERMWQVGLIFLDRKVAASSVTVFDGNHVVK